MATSTFQMRIAAEDRLHLRELATRARRSESEVLRLLLRQADPERVNSGIPLPTRLERAEARAAEAAPKRGDSAA